MSLQPGARLRPYQIAALIGVGGPASARAVNARELRRGLAEVRPFPKIDDELIQVSQGGGGGGPIWSPDGKSI